MRSAGQWFISVACWGFNAAPTTSATMHSDEHWMQCALDLAANAGAGGEVPVGAHRLESTMRLSFPKIRTA